MKPYGINPRYDQSCCHGHDTLPKETYSNRRSKKAQARDTKIARRRERSVVRINLRQEA